MHLEHFDAKSHQELSTAFKSCYTKLYWKYYDILKCAFKERNIFSLISPVRIPALWNYSIAPKFLRSSPDPLQNWQALPWYEKGLGWEVKSPSSRADLIASAWDSKQAESETFDGSSCCLLLHVTWIQGVLTLSPHYGGKLWYSLCIIYEAGANAPEDTQQEIIVRQHWHAKTPELLKEFFFTYRSKTIQMKSSSKKSSGWHFW